MVIEDTTSQIHKNQSPKSPRAHAVEFPLASPLDRFAAFVVDHLVLLSPVILLLTAPFERQFKEAMMVSNEVELVWASLNIFVMAFSVLFIYHSVFLSMVGSTLGQIFMGLRVVRVWDGGPVGIWNAVLRTLSWIASALVFGLPLLAVFSDAYRRTWYDRMSDTVVITKRKHRSTKMPALFETSLVQGFLAAFIVFVLGIFALATVKALKDYSRDSKILALLEEDGILCPSVGEALAEWPLEEGEEASRVSVSLGLYFAGRVDVSCVEAEFDPRALAIQNDDLAKLAKAIVYSDHEELSQLYLQSTCETRNSGTACAIARATTAFIEDDLDTVDEYLGGIQPNAPVYAKIWALRYYVESDQFDKGEPYLEGMSGVTALAEAIVPLKTKILWGQGKQLESEGAMQVAYQVLPPKELANLSSWICYDELNQSCENWDSTSCSSFQAMARDYATVLAESSRALTFVKKKECESGGQLDMASMQLDQLAEEGLLLVDAIRSGRAEGFLDILEDEELPDSLRAEAAAHLLKVSKVKAHQEIVQEYWESMPIGRAWKVVGKAMLNQAIEKRDYEVAEGIAGQLNDWSKGRDRELLETLVVSEYYLGKVELAKNLLKTYAEEHALEWFRIKADRAEAGRSPAAQADEFATIVRSLE